MAYKEDQDYIIGKDPAIPMNWDVKERRGIGDPESYSAAIKEAQQQRAIWDDAPPAAYNPSPVGMPPRVSTQGVPGYTKGSTSYDQRGNIIQPSQPQSGYPGGMPDRQSSNRAQQMYDQAGIDLKQPKPATQKASSPTGIAPDTNRAQRQGGDQIGLLEEQTKGFGGTAAGMVNQQNKGIEYGYSDSAISGPMAGVGAVPGIAGAYKNTDVPESEFGKAIYADSFQGAMPQGFGQAGPGAVNPDNPGPFSRGLSDESNPGNPYGRSDATQAQIQANVGSLNRATEAMRGLNDERQAQVNAQDPYSATGAFSGRGGGVESEARARALGDTGVYGKAGYGFGYGPAGVGDDGSGDIYRREAASLLKTMPFGKTGDRRKRQQIMNQVSQLRLLAEGRDKKQTGDAALDERKKLNARGDAYKNKQLDAIGDRFGQKMDQDEYQFGVKTETQKDQFATTSAQRDKQLGINETIANKPAGNPWTVVQGNPQEVDEYGIVTREAMPTVKLNQATGEYESFDGKPSGKTMTKAQKEYAQLLPAQQQEVDKLTTEVLAGNMSPEEAKAQIKALLGEK